jgi:hypothetical protein
MTIIPAAISRRIRATIAGPCAAIRATMGIIHTIPRMDTIRDTTVVGIRIVVTVAAVTRRKPVPTPIMMTVNATVAAVARRTPLPSPTMMTVNAIAAVPVRHQEAVVVIAAGAAVTAATAMKQDTLF